MLLENPYYNRKAIGRKEDFYGRSDAIKQIYNLLKKNQSCCLIGPRKIGKTSLLFHLARSTTMQEYNLPASGFYFIRINFERLGIVPIDEFFFKMAQTAIKEIANHLIEEDVRRLIEMDFDRSFYGLIDVIEHIHQLELIRREEKPNLVYVFDEFDLACQNEYFNPGFYGQLRSLTEPDTNVTFLISTKKPLIELPFSRETRSSPFFNFFIPFSIGLFSKEETLELIIKPSSMAGLSLKDEADFILDLAKRHPFYTQVLCWHIFELKSKKKTITQDDLQQAAKGFLQEISQQLKYYWKDLSEEERIALEKTLKELLS